MNITSFLWDQVDAVGGLTWKHRLHSKDDAEMLRNNSIQDRAALFLFSRQKGGREDTFLD